MWPLLHLLKSTISYTFYASCKTGQFIVTSVQLLVTNCVQLVLKLFSLLTVIIEDFTIFLSDLVENVKNVVGTVASIGEGIFAAVYSLVQLPQIVWDSVALLWEAVANGLLIIIGVIKNIFIFIKQTIIMFGDGVWFIIIFIPKSLLSLIPLTFYYVKDLIYGTCNKINHIYASLFEYLYNCYYFLTDVPLESFIGLVIALCFLYIFIQFYSIFLVYLRNKVSSFLSGLRLKYRRMKNILYKVRFFNKSTEEIETSTKTDNFNGCCIICQEYDKCILVLPCRHLCLCNNCTPRLMRSSGRCPICRKRITSTMRIFT